MEKVVLCKTKAGKGMKVCVGGKWFYTSLVEISKLLAGKAKAVTFRTIASEVSQ